MPPRNLGKCASRVRSDRPGGLDLPQSSTVCYLRAVFVSGNFSSVQEFFAFIVDVSGTRLESMLVLESDVKFTFGLLSLPIVVIWFINTEPRKPSWFILAY